MKVAIFTDTYLPQINGVTKTLGRFVEYMEKNNIDYRVFAPVDGNKEYNDKIIRFFSFRFFLYPECRVSLPNYFAMSKQLRNFNPDIIHIVTPFNIGLCGLKYAKDYNVPLVSSYHTNIPEYLEYFNLKFLSNVSWDFFRWFHAHCQKNYCPSKVTMELLESKGINNLEIWGRGINTNKFTSKNRSQDFRKKYSINDKLAILYVGRVSPEKDLDVFIEAAKRLNKKYYEKIHFVVVGNGPMLNELKDQGITNMSFTGFLKGESLQEAYASSDIFMFPSSTETYGNVILEAMASQVPVIACYAGGIKENLIDGYNGMACKVRDVDDFYESCEKLILNQDLRELLKKNGREYTLKRTWDSIYDKLIDSYEGVIDTYSYRKSKITA